MKRLTTETRKGGPPGLGWLACVSGLVLLFARVVSGQSISLQAYEAADGLVAVSVSLAYGTTGARDAPAAVQSELIYDAEYYYLYSVVASENALSVGKSAIYHEVAAGTVRVIVSGFNQEIIPPGELAVVYLASLEGGRTGYQSGITCALEQTVISDPMGDAIPLENSDPEPVANPGGDLVKEDVPAEIGGEAEFDPKTQRGPALEKPGYVVRMDLPESEENPPANTQQRPQTSESPADVIPRPATRSGKYIAWLEREHKVDGNAVSSATAFRPGILAERRSFRGYIAKQEQPSTPNAAPQESVRPARPLEQTACVGAVAFGADLATGRNGVAAAGGREAAARAVTGRMQRLTRSEVAGGTLLLMAGAALFLFVTRFAFSKH